MKLIKREEANRCVLCVEASLISIELWEILQNYSQKLGFLTLFFFFFKWAVAIEKAFLPTALWFGEKLQNRKEKRQRNRSELHSGERSSRDKFTTTILRIRSQFWQIKRLIEKMFWFSLGKRVTIQPYVQK